MHKYIIPLFLILGLTMSFEMSSQTYIYKNPKYTADERAADLLQRMSLDEKVYQLQSQMVYTDFNKRDYRIGNVRNKAHFMHKDSPRRVLPSECAKALNEDTKSSISASRWGIPVLQNGEALHGAQWGNATCFPQSIAMAATFDNDLYYNVGQIVARELRAVGVRQVFAPVINISRDPRWGRTEETYGEDVLLNSLMGKAYVSALEQGGIISTPKHFVDNYADGGHDSYASNLSWRALRETVLEPFRVCFQEGGARSVMAAYNSIDGTPCTDNKVLLDNILRKEWGFRGFVVSDYSGVSGVYGAHHVAKDYKDAEAKSLMAGLDVELPNGYSNLLELVKEGKVTEQQLDSSVMHVLRCKFELGLFDDPYVDAKKADKVVGNIEAQALAQKAADECMTLLKNKDNILPLSDSQIKRVGVFGPTADILSLGDYNGPFGGRQGDKFLTPYQALKQRLAGKAEVLLYDPSEDLQQFVSKCDVALFFGAINEGEGADRSIMSLPSKPMKTAKSLDNAIIVKNSNDVTINVDQEKMILDLAASKVKTIVILQNGSWIDVSRWIDKVDGLFEAWYPGQEGAKAIAGTLFGDKNPGGRLPFTWAKHTGQLPIYYSIKPSGRGYAYNDDDGKPLFPFGYGLSYSSFEYSNLQIPSQLAKNDSLEVKFTLKNTGKVAGDEVAQLYMKDEHASVVRPILQMKAFKRVTLNPGESKEVTLKVPYQAFGIWNSEMKYVVEPRQINILISSDAQTMHLNGAVDVQ